VTRYLARGPWLAEGDYLSEFEGDLRDWVFVYGLAYALTRTEAGPV